MAEDNKTHHYFMVTGEIVFSPENEENVHAIRMNAIITGESKELPVRALGKAQQALQVQFYQRMDTTKVNVRDVVLMNFSYLGYMTKEEFEKPPEGMKQIERSAQEDGTNSIFNDAADSNVTH